MSFSVVTMFEQISKMIILIIGNLLSLQVVRSATTGTGSSICGVAPGSNGSKELHYILRSLCPAACRDPELFADVSKSILRINLPIPSKRGI